MDQVRIALERKRAGELRAVASECEVREVDFTSADSKSIELIRLKMKDHSRMNRYREVIARLQANLRDRVVGTQCLVKDEQ
jgi:hypothetical protein